MSERSHRSVGRRVEDVLPEGDDDFAGEHDDTSVEGKVTSGRDDDREPESPRGWSGLETGGVADQRHARTNPSSLPPGRGR